ncbi:MAG: FAD-dependent oxidoreductase [Clostridia bacterium]|nr:FAD-dependent oxidoreductase [Clostridia bacterium]MDH7572195.1 FAD-dependent oxidoreductase [Clostridia bacterium]
MVVGGGIAGMQAALDLASSGFYVHLVTDSPSLGGRMTQLDKTFPTNDCAMCLLGPRMTDTLNHPNIAIHTCSNVEGVTGRPGQFRVKVRKRPRYINLRECTACGDCEQVCPVEVPDLFNEEMNTRKAVYKLFPQAVPNKYLIEKRGTPPCRSTCPAGTNVQGYVALISQGKFTEALEVVRRRMPFAAVCGRICHHPCEEECNRAEFDAPVAIQWLKRAAADFGEDRPPAPPAERRPEKVAVIGAGPAGLVAAFDLAQEGFRVTVFDALNVAGGLLRAGIPRYRLPEAAVERDLAWLLAGGAELKLGVRVGQDVSFEDLRREYQAVLIAVGAGASRGLDVPGTDLEGVWPGLSFLREAALGDRPQVGSKVLVIGGGNVAVDAARTALRLGAETVEIVYRRTKEQMPAHAWEIAEAEEEGVVVHTCWVPRRILGENGRVTGMEFIRVEPAVDAEGRFAPREIPGSERVFPADTVILAVGQATDLSFLGPESGVEVRRDGTIKVDPVTMATTAAGVFACGDVVLGPSSVVEAVGSAHEAALSVSRYLRGEDMAAGRQKETGDKLGPPPKVKVEPRPRLEPRLLSPAERRTGFGEVSPGYTREEAIEEARRCLNCGICSECLQCAAACQKKAIEHDQREEMVEIEVGAVIAAPGYSLYEGRAAGEYGYGVYPNVMTSMEFERLLSSTGPTQGEIVRPGDGAHVRRLAFIQCVGSRDEARAAEYCSAVCCMYATKEALIAREHDPNIEPTIFYLDMRSYGKNFDRYVDTAKVAGVRYLRSMISAVKEDPVTRNLIIRYVADGEIREEEFDLVVLSVGLRPPAAARELARALGIELNRYGFALTDPLRPVFTTREGIFAAGAFQGPRDIPETVMNASAAAAAAAEFLAPARGQRVRAKEYPPERDVSSEEPRVGVFVCHCGLNIASVVDVEAVTQFARELPGVVYAEHNLYTCSQDSLKRIQEIIERERLNRVVVASCTIRTHQPLFREALREVGLNQFLFEMANIRDQCSWVHRLEPEEATAKAKDLVAMAVAKVKTHRPLHLSPVPVVQKALVVGGGAAGLTAALSLAEQGYETFVVEKEAELGGRLRFLRYSLEGDDLQIFLLGLLQKVREHPLIKIYTRARVEDFGGHQGHFVTTISVGEAGREHVRRTVRLEHGVVIVATGTEENRPREYLLGQDPRVLTNTEFEQLMAASPTVAQAYGQVVFIQCVGSRNAERPYCSRVCCSHSLKNALRLKASSPGTDVFVLFRDLRAYGFLEHYYRQARARGVIFVPYPDDRPPEVERRDDALRVRVFDRSLGEEIRLQPDALVLATGAVAPAGVEKLANQLKLTRNEDGFFVEMHAKLGPMDCPSPGIFLCGSAHAPKNLGEAIAQAQGAAARAATVLSQPELLVGGVVAVVEPEKCAACLTCVRVCPYGVPRISAQNVAEINPVQCQGCGTCAGECPAKAIQLEHYRDEQLMAKVTGLFSA